VIVHFYVPKVHEWQTVRKGYSVMERGTSVNGQKEKVSSAAYLLRETYSKQALFLFPQPVTQCEAYVRLRV